MFPFQVETLYETLYIVVPSEQSRLECINQLNAYKPPRHISASLDHLPIMWTMHTSYLQADGSHRAVLNGKKLFRTEEEALPCTEVVESLLQSAISLNMLLQDSASVRKSLHCVADKVANFLNSASLLRFVDLTTLETQESRVCFYLNVYQILLWHARIAYGAPLNAKQSLSFNRRMCYQLGSQQLVLSLAEIEHLILRAKLPPSALAPPMDKQTKALYIDIQNKYGLEHPDFRLSIVLYSIEPLVTCFDGDFVHEQLNAACAHMLQTSIQVNQATKIIYLPKLCEWNRLDFGNANTNGIHCARKLAGFLQGELLNDMQTLIEADTPFLVKYV
ncbi:hypothetical protein THRCLA_11132 [Thraustotheca clavata]|uniref:DUF547 domain-containing protein n=1 Tax=Thraustotheca clavata TaxID=74557 RepID=A0A1V9Y8Q8_9STRA|nr:hypothetical protein THRCLA_11132 [Thraustotheca clavata]